MLTTLLAMALTVAGTRAALSCAPDSPTAAIRCLATAYDDRSPDAYASLLAADYRFHTNDDHLGRFSVTGLDRDHEVASTRALMVGVGGATDPYARGASAIHARWSGVSEGLDPEHPDSLAWYRAVTVDSFALELHFVGAPVTTTNPSRHVFYLVRGDVAQRVAGQPADAGRWYVRRWLEDVTGAATRLAGMDGDCAEARADTSAMSVDLARPGSGLAIHPLGNPACPALAIRCDLPGREPARVEVYDVSGRRVAHNEIAIGAPGTRTLEAGAGAHLAPGAYWVRLSQGNRRPSTAMVVVAR